MSKTNKFAIIVSFFALWINVTFSPNYQQVIGFVVIFLFGILHGANDLALFQKISATKKSISLQKLTLYYIGIVIFGALLFYSIPIVALLLFIFFSSYHFGEQHWNTIETKEKNSWITLFQTIYGLFIFGLLFSFHEIEVEKIIYQITTTSIEQLDFKWITICIGLLMIASGIKVNSVSMKFKSEIVVNIFYLIVFAVIFKTADLVWAFAIYFVIWHSLSSIEEQINYLYGSFTLKNFRSYFISAFPYWITSLFGIFILYFIFKDNELFNALFFSFLAAITFPHTIIIIKMQNSK
jgi:Brp/Blh family beta-carotene 15,15'-monooxygenase